MLHMISFNILSGRAANRYLEWVIDLSNTNFWRAMSCQKPVRDALVVIDQYRPRRLFVEINKGGPLGKIVSMIATRPDRITGLFIQQFGEDNLVPCRCCETKFVQSEMTSARDGPRAGMYYMFGCRSIPGMAESACGNCIMGVTQSECEFRLDHYAPLRASLSNRKSDDLGNPKAVLKFSGSNMNYLFQQLDAKFGPLPLWSLTERRK
jgi:hypothetical protein